MVAAYPTSLLTDTSSQAGLHPDLHNQLTNLIFNIVAYGADPTGATDSSPGIQAAVNAAKVAGSAAYGIQGGIVFGPPGNFRCQSEIDWAGNVSCLGCGSRTTQFQWSGTDQPGASLFLVQNGTGSVQGVTFRDFAIDGSNGFAINKGVGYGLRLVGVQQSLFQNLYITACGVQDLRLEASATNSVRMNTFNGLVLDVCDQTFWMGAPGAANGVKDCTNNTFINTVSTFGLTGSTNNGAYIGSADQNIFIRWQMVRRAGTGYGTELDTREPFHGGNIFHDMLSTVVVDNGTVGYDTIYNYDMANGEAAPVINGTAKLTWTSGNNAGTGWHLADSLYSHGTGGIGYETGAGGQVVQATSKATAVTLNVPVGQIQMNNASLAGATSVTFTVNNSSVAINDVVVLNIQANNTANSYQATVDHVAAGVFSISLRNITGGALAESVTVNFAVIKGVAA